MCSYTDPTYRTIFARGIYTDDTLVGILGLILHQDEVIDKWNNTILKKYPNNVCVRASCLFSL